MEQVKLLVFDVDGVLTDGKIYYGSDETEYKSFHTKDGLGINLAHHVGIKTALITGRDSKAVKKRANELKIDALYQGVHDKVKVLQEIINKFEIQLQHVCYMGDDLNDLPIMQIVGYPAAPQNAVPLVKNFAKFVSNANGGEGAVRELIDHILAEKYDYKSILGEYFNGKITFTQ